MNVVKNLERGVMIFFCFFSGKLLKLVRLKISS